jgi:hypothetical protein
MQTTDTTKREDESEVGRRVPSSTNGFRNFGKMTLFVRSKKIGVSNVVASMPALTGLSTVPIGYYNQRVFVYEQRLDEQQSDAVKSGRLLARGLGLELEVKDISKANAVTRFFRFLTRDKLARKTPSVSFDSDAMASLFRDERHRLSQC